MQMKIQMQMHSAVCFMIAIGLLISLLRAPLIGHPAAGEEASQVEQGKTLQEELQLSPILNDACQNEAHSPSCHHVCTSQDYHRGPRMRNGTNRLTKL